MSNIFESAAEKLGINKDAVTEQAENLLNQHRDQIPDPIEGKIDEALHGGALEGILEKVGIGGHKEEAKADEDESEESSDDSDEDSEEDESSDEEASSDDDDSEEESSNDDSEESDDDQ